MTLGGGGPPGSDAPAQLGALYRGERAKSGVGAGHPAFAPSLTVEIVHRNSAEVGDQPFANRVAFLAGAGLSDQATGGPRS